MSDNVEGNLIWSEHHDPFWGQCIVIKNLVSKWESSGERSDYVALFTGADDPKYEFSRRFMKSRYGQCCLPVDSSVKSKQFTGVSLDGAILEIRVDGTKYVRLISAGRLEPIANADIRPALAAWLFSTGQSLHP